MLLQRTKEGSQFYRFHENSEVAKTCLTTSTPKIDGREVDILQIAYVDSKNYNIIIEFIYRLKIQQ